jgi:hypothetical protein
MRMMLRAVVDTEAGTEALRNGTMAKLIEQTVQQLHPEAAYFLTSDDGHRSCVMVFDLDDPSRIPAVSEPFYQGGAEKVTLQPCMNLDDLQRGLGQLQG